MPLQAADDDRSPVRPPEVEGEYGSLLQADQGNVCEPELGVSPPVHVAGMLPLGFRLTFMHLLLLVVV